MRSPGVAPAVFAAAVLASAVVAISGCGPRGPGPAPSSPPLVLFGIDGADWDRAMPLVRQGKMPALARLVRGGARRTLRSLEPERLSPTIWTTVATGVLPEKHGILHFVQAGPDGSMQPITANQRRVAALWNMFTARDVPVGVIGWLATWPAEPVKGYLVSSYTPFVFDWGAGKPLKGTLVDGVPNQVWPPALEADLAALKIPPASVDDSALASRFRVASTGAPVSADAAESIDGMRWSWAADETYRRVWRRLREAPPDGARPRLEMIYYGSVDVMSHRFWKYMEPATSKLGAVDSAEARAYGESIERAYASVDEALAEVLAAEHDSARIIVLSDHGFRENQDPQRATSSGWHRPEGLFVAAGAEFRSGVLLPAGSVVDVAPTVLYASRLPVGEDMDGRPALELFKDAVRAAFPVETIPSWEPESARARAAAPVASPVDEEILERLRALGYIQ